MSPAFTVAAILLAAMGIVHSYLGERFILIRLMRLELPVLFGDDGFTKATLRFVWHALSLAWFGMCALLILVPTATVGWIMVASLAATIMLTVIISRGRHLSWVVELAAIAALLVDLA